MGCQYPDDIASTAKLGGPVMPGKVPEDSEMKHLFL